MGAGKGDLTQLPQRKGGKRRENSLLQREERKTKGDTL